ncbi:hypothetical protein QBC41DRAFT_298978 [Cercophora samala]|uniref:Uncharacterized protein n=1 Tax=Cercophora samala TaxID=330535 RepID=A0AA39ZL88_9PEZI|nr:hypothetical protein QBC41DRAFT_298978 [Cercophora samala]
MDYQLLLSYKRDDYIDSIRYLRPPTGTNREYEVVECAQDSLANLRILTETELEGWLSDNTTTASQFLLGVSRGSRQTGNNPAFPHLDCFSSDSLPLSHSLFVKVLSALGLPDATPALLHSNSTHFQWCTMGPSDKEQRRVGLVMRLASRGILESDMTLSAAYSPATGTVTAFLHGCTSDQQEEVGNKLLAFSPLFAHPLLLSVILAEMRLDAIDHWRRSLWRLLLDVETRSGQTGAPTLHAASQQHQMYDKGQDYWVRVAMDALTVMQLAAGMEDHANCLKLILSEMTSMLSQLPEAAGCGKTSRLVKTGWLIKQKVQSLSHGLDITISGIQYIMKRGEAQQSAVYNFTAQQDSSMQKDIAMKSANIAHSAKLDSSAMKGIAVLTMVFLPATFMAVGTLPSPVGTPPLTHAGV